MIEYILFDLDGTLLPMDQDEFVKVYLYAFIRYLAPHQYEPESFKKGMLAGWQAMVMNDGSKTNENAFYDTFQKFIEKDVLKDQQLFLDFYKTDFLDVKKVTSLNPEAKKTIDTLKEKGYPLILATNPLFPRIATLTRLQWAGLEEDDFDLITTYEDEYFCKPNLKYYESLLERIQVPADHCLMVGNDVDEDLIAEELGMHVFLLDECLINLHHKNIDQCPKGSYQDLLDYLEKLEASHE